MPQNEVDFLHRLQHWILFVENCSPHQGPTTVQVGEAWVYPGMTSANASLSKIRFKTTKQRHLWHILLQYKPTPLQLLERSWDNTAAHKVDSLPVVRLSRSEMAKLNGQYLFFVVVVEIWPSLNETVRNTMRLWATYPFFPFSLISLSALSIASEILWIQNIKRPTGVWVNDLQNDVKNPEPQR